MPNGQYFSVAIRQIAEWGPCPALPAEPRRAEAGAWRLVCRLPHSSKRTLRAFALGLHRVQQQLGIELPPPG